MALFLGRHLPMRRGSGVASEGFCVTHVDKTFDELESVVELRSGFKAAHDPEGKERARASAEVFLCQAVIRIVGEARIVDPFDTWIVAQKFGDAPRVLDMTLDTQRHRFDA